MDADHTTCQVYAEMLEAQVEELHSKVTGLEARVARLQILLKAEQDAIYHHVESEYRPMDIYGKRT